MTRSRACYRSVRAKVYWTEQILKQAARGAAGDIWVFTDADVVPLASYWHLARHNFSHEIQFMREVHQHRGLSNWVVNSGFYMLRNTARVRRFLRMWAVRLMSSRKLKDQDALNWLLLNRVKADELDWAGHAGIRMDQAHYPCSADPPAGRVRTFEAVTTIRPEHA